MGLPIKLPSETVSYRDSEMKIPESEINTQRKTEEENVPYKSSASQFNTEKKLKSFSLISKFATTYELEKYKKNSVVVFNNKYFTGAQTRHGTEIDVASIEDTFCRFGFEVSSYHDLKKHEVMDTLSKFTENDFTDYGCVVVAILSHGTNGGHIYAADGAVYTEADVINFFTAGKAPTLVTKPKIFIIQACRGDRDPMGVYVNEPVGVTIKTDQDDEKSYTLLYESDMLILNSSYNGRPSFRDSKRGSWFIQSLCNKINQLADTHDLEAIVTEVKREVAIEYTHEVFNRNTSDIQIYKQMPVMTSTLIRKLFLRKFQENKVSPIILNMIPQSFKPTEEGRKAATTHQHKSCSCYLEHFEYMRNCLKFYLEDNPGDTLGQSFYAMAKLFHGPLFNAAKKSMIAAIVQHLKSKNFKYFNYLHIYDNNICNDCHNQQHTVKEEIRVD